MSLIKEVWGVKGMQSPKQPQVLIFPENIDFESIIQVNKKYFVGDPLLK